MIYKCVLVTLDLFWFEDFIGALCFWLSGGLMGDHSPPENPCHPGLGSLGQKVEIFDRSPLPVPVGPVVPSGPLAGEPEAGFLLTWLLGSSSELSWWPRFELALMLSISFSSSEAADASSWVVIGEADPEFETVGSFICWGIIWADPGSWEIELVQGTLFWIDFWFFMLSSRFKRESMVCVSQSSSDLKLLGDVMHLSIIAAWQHWHMSFWMDRVLVLRLVVWLHRRVCYFEILFWGFLSRFSTWGKFCCMRDDHHHRNLHVLFHFDIHDPHDLAVRILQIFVHFCRIFCYGNTFSNRICVEDLVHTPLYFDWEIQPWFPGEFPVHLLSKYMNLPVSTIHLSASSFFPLL